jgi:hypothetical protein
MTYDEPLAQYFHDTLELLEKRGWTQGVMKNTTTGAYCLLGAAESFDPDFHKLEAYTKLQKAISIVDPSVLEPNRTYENIGITTWNDEPGRSFQEVKKVLQVAIDLTK